jgi:uncharacterized protein YgiM (DUF1202 family)
MSSVGKSYKLNAKAKTTLSYKSSNTSVATVDKNGVVKIKGEGTAVITITASKSSTYKSATKKVTIKVTRKTIKYKATANLYYRTGAGTNYKAVGKFKKGQTVYVLEKTEKKDKQSRTWVKVKVNGKTYWCCKSYLKKA